MAGFVKNIWNKVHDWWISFEFRHLRIARLIVYFTCLAVVVLICFILFRYFNLFHTDADSARYMLSALVQSQAAIVAIVITLTLIAVQLTASAYSPRVINIFKKNPDMWILLGCYGVSIFYGFIVLKLVEGAEGEFVSQSVIWSLGLASISFEFCISLAYWLGAFTFVALFPYMWYIISLLKSENIIKRLSEDITKDKILNLKEDPIQPIMDIIHGSIMKYDLETTRVGIKAVTGQVIEIIDSDTEREISKLFCEHLERAGRLAISREDEDSTVEVIENLENFGKSTADRSLESATVQAIKSLGAVGIAVKEGLEFAKSQAASSLGKVGVSAVEKGFEDVARQAASILFVSVVKVAAEKGLENVTSQAARSLGDIGIAATEKKFEILIYQVAGYLREVGRTALGKGFEDATWQAGRSLKHIGIAAAEKGLESAAEQAAKYYEMLSSDKKEIKDKEKT
ncbi:MAG: DUF2254 domain-containing protein [Methanophagales archaeon]|nr:DUF2254 domain-containing protein [Methanophagales archaeon]